MGETGDVEGVNRDLRPETQFMDGTQGRRPGILKVELENLTQDPYYTWH